MHGAHAHGAHAPPTTSPVLAQLDGLPFVKDVHRDRPFVGKLNWVPEGELARLFADGMGGGGTRPAASPSGFAAASFSATGGGGSGSAVGGDSGSDGTEEEVMKRPGRLSTPFPSMDEEGVVYYDDDGSEGDAYYEEGGDEQQQEGAESEQQRRHLQGDGGSRHSLDGVIDAAGGLRSTEQDAGGAGEVQRTRRGVSMHLGGGDPALASDGSSRDGGGPAHAGTGSGSRRSGRRKLSARATVTDLMHASKLWALGFTGKGIKVGVFDTGIIEKHPHIRNIAERTNWTHQQSLSDGLGHGSFVAGVIGSQDTQCPGFAPDVELYTFKVFTDDQVSYTSWFLDAFNYALSVGLQIINLSIGGPDFLDQPFVDKVLEITSNGIIMVSAIGNDGPHWGTLNNPADQNDVIGVGGIDDLGHIAAFSSRGMSTWELPTGSGRVKPDVMAYGREVMGSRINSGCRTLSGTSVSSPVVAGAVCLLASTVPMDRRWMLNPASMKQALVEGAEKLPTLSMYEQGNGKVDLEATKAILDAYTPRASAIPRALDMTSCPYFWPYCAQPLYSGALPVVINVTLLNALDVVGWLDGRPAFAATNEAGQHLHVEFAYSDILWPWSGFLAVYVRVRPSGAAFTGTAEGTITLTIVSPPRAGVAGASEQRSTVTIPIKAHIVPTPPRNKRLIWDQFHNIKYPPGYMPRDNLDIKHDVLDWHGDMLWTNFHTTFDTLRQAGYFVEVLASPFTCFDATNYAALVIVDSEDEFYPQEIEKMADDVKTKGLSLVVFGEWYNVQSMMGMRFFDDNTRSWWTPATGGSNVPALNDLLAPFDIALGDSIITGQTKIGAFPLSYHHGSDVARAPAGAFLHRATLLASAGSKVAGERGFGMLSVSRPGGGAAGTPTGGAVVVLGDANCLDSSHQSSNCFELLKAVLAAAIEGAQNGVLDDSWKLEAAFERPGYAAPQRRKDVNFTEYSFVLRHPLTCYANAPCESQGSAACPALVAEPAATSGAHSGADGGDRLRRQHEAVTEKKTPHALGGGGGSTQGNPFLSSGKQSEHGELVQVVDTADDAGRYGALTGVVAAACVLGAFAALVALVMRARASRAARGRAASAQLAGRARSAGTQL